MRDSDAAAFPLVLEWPFVHALNRRIAAASGTDVAQGEALQILRYAPGQQYRPHLDAVPGMVQALEETVRGKGRPFLGICVGMQLMAERGREYVVTDGLGWIRGEVDKITPSDPALKIPHMGWNTLAAATPHKLLNGIPLGADGLHAYFVHSYQLRPLDCADLVAQADYGGPITAIVARDSMAGTQFHPEKSQKLGLALIANFLRWKP